MSGADQAESRGVAYALVPADRLQYLGEAAGILSGVSLCTLPNVAMGRGSSSRLEARQGNVSAALEFAGWYAGPQGPLATEGLTETTPEFSSKAEANEGAQVCMLAGGLVVKLTNFQGAESPNTALLMEEVQFLALEDHAARLHGQT